jgi:hypothetical protein
LLNINAQRGQVERRGEGRPPKKFFKKLFNKSAIKPKTKDPPGILVEKALTPWISAKI